MGGAFLREVSVSGGSTVFASSSDWLIALFVSVMTGQSD